jgi:3-oxoacyl-[acyl-carrier-protein] synthase I
MSLPMVIRRVGMCTAVGLSAPAACAAIRVGITGFNETGFMYDRDWLQGAEVHLEQPWRGREKLLRMAESVVRECIEECPPAVLREVPLLLNLAEADRPGRLKALDFGFLHELIQRLGSTFHPDSRVLQNGRVGGVQALDVAEEFFRQRRCTACFVVGVDSLLSEQTLRAYHELRRLLTQANSDGFIPGEAAGALWLEPAANPGEPQLTICGWGYGREDAHITSELPLKGLGLAQAIKEAIRSGGIGFQELDYRICDANGEQYIFKEAAIALARTLRGQKDVPDIWHAADCIGEVGAATVPCALAVAWAAAHKHYAPGTGVIAHFGNDDGERAAVTLRYE